MPRRWSCSRCPWRDRGKRRPWQKGPTRALERVFEPPSLEIATNAGSLQRLEEFRSFAGYVRPFEYEALGVGAAHALRRREGALGRKEPPMKRLAIILFGAGSLASFGCESSDVRNVGDVQREAARTDPLVEGHVVSWQESIAEWPASSRGAAQDMFDKYGEPDEVTATQLVWHDSGPWKKSIV